MLGLIPCIGLHSEVSPGPMPRCDLHAVQRVACLHYKSVQVVLMYKVCTRSRWPQLRYASALHDSQCTPIIVCATPPPPLPPAHR